MEKTYTRFLQLPLDHLPPPMQRQPRQEKSYAKPLLNFVTHEKDLTPEQKKPIVSKKLPAHEKAEFPRPLPSRPIAKAPRVRFVAAPPVVVEPMRRNKK